MDGVDARLDLRVIFTLTESMSVFSCAIVVAPMMLDVTNFREVTKAMANCAGRGQVRAQAKDMRRSLPPSRGLISLAALEQRRSGARGRAPF